MPDGHVRITSGHWDNQFWRRSPNWIWADSDQSSIDDSDTHFWPVKVDDNTIALRNAGNNNYCVRLSTEGKTDMLNADVQNITNEARLVVQELVSQRNIYNVVYRMQDARIYDEVPYVASSSVLTNSSDQEAAMAVQITYQDEKSYTFSRNLSLTAGVETTFSTGMPFIVEGEITVSFEINTTLQWETATKTTTSVVASGSIPVPAKSTAVIEYVGTKGTCDVPYSYTQQDKSSADGSVSYTEQADGIYKGISFYNFHFVVKSAKALF
ncbi:natterin-1-like [Salvia hispanica]|uniref:natterin-1-like n=1 Tax=Salvia hispanica TaxID=49212 RepID=UPI0020091274|nr:natterin-1-like [Salvia hispanica]XP_047957995.1 natterin-1-like [Salvia hispanica]